MRLPCPTEKPSSCVIFWGLFGWPFCCSLANKTWGWWNSWQMAAVFGGCLFSIQWIYRLIHLILFAVKFCYLVHCDPLVYKIIILHGRLDVRIQRRLPCCFRIAQLLFLAPWYCWWFRNPAITCDVPKGYIFHVNWLAGFLPTVWVFCSSLPLKM